MKRYACIACIPLALLAAACDDRSAADTKSTPDAAAGARTSAPLLPPAQVESMPTLNIDEGAATLSGMRIDFTGDAKGKLTAALADNAKVAGSVVPVEAMRNATMARIATALAALKAAKAKGAILRTAMRDPGVLGSLEVRFDVGVPARCSAVAMIGKDSAISVWAAGGGGGQRFSRGMAGPDITLGSDGLRRASAACDSPDYFLSADDSVKWGLVFDLAMAARGGEAGAMRATQAHVLLAVPVAGRKLPE